MRKLLTCLFAISMIAPFSYNASGAVSRVLPGGNDVSVDTSRTTSSRVATRDAGATKNASDTTARSTVSRVVSGTPTAASKTQSRTGVVSRAVTQTSGDKRGGLSSAVNTVGRNERVSSASINANPSVRRAGLVLRPSTAEVGGRATIGDSGVQTGSNIDEELRGVKSRAAAAPTAESITQAKERLENTASLNKSCQDQYNECMDQFCAIVDQNQKRCSCSANISRYSKVEEAVKDANAQLNEVAQNIRYVGLSADEIRAILTETEAEIALNGTTDTSANRSMLDDIEDLIRNPTSSASYSNTNNMDFGLDLDLDFSSESADIFSLDFLNMGGSSSVSNLRGADLYNAAKKRCNTVLNQCKEAGGTVKQVTGNYDLLIDKDCIAYEQGLSKMNDTLLSNVRSANLMLQKARLAVLQNKNQYDAKGCVAALETCMTDDMVCGENYFKCVDPTKKYIDENGEVILGQNISNIKKFMVDYNNAGIDKKMLQDTYSSTKINDTDCATSPGNDGRCVVKYLLNKIGTKARVTDEGLCRAVMEKCQYYSYDKNNNYMPFNDIVVNYIQRAMVNIRAAQYNIISDYASSCMLDVANCYNQQVTQVNSWSSAASISSIYNVMKGACRDVALTCAYAVFDGDATLCPIGGSPTENDTCINSISDMFYNSMLCAEGEQYDKATGKCHNVANKVVWNFNNLADGFDDPSNLISNYLEKDKPFKLPVATMLKNYNGTGGLLAKNAWGQLGCAIHASGWCYMVSATEIKCFPFAKNDPGSDCTNGTDTWTETIKQSIEIPASDVNKMIENGNTKINLSIATGRNYCSARPGAYWDERGCTCIDQEKRSGNNECPPVSTISCPSGYVGYYSNNKTNITMCMKPAVHFANKTFNYLFCSSNNYKSICNEEDIFKGCSTLADGKSMNDQAVPCYTNYEF